MPDIKVDVNKIIEGDHLVSILISIIVGVTVYILAGNWILPCAIGVFAVFLLLLELCMRLHRKQKTTQYVCNQKQSRKREKEEAIFEYVNRTILFFKSMSEYKLSAALTIYRYTSKRPCQPNERFVEAFGDGWSVCVQVNPFMEGFKLPKART